jgi:hypothetical protein
MLYSITSYAQVTEQEKTIAFDLVRANLEKIKFTSEDLNNSEVSSTYYTPASQLRMVYLQQAYLGIPVFNQMQVLAFKNQQLLSFTGSRIDLINQLTNNNEVPTITPAQAILTACMNEKITSKIQPVLINKENNKFNYGTLGISYVPVTAQLVWLPVNSKLVRLTWQVELAPMNSSDHLLIRVDAEKNIVLDKNNYTLYEQFNDLINDKQNLTTSDKSQLHQFINQAEIQSPSVVTNAAYRVIPYPAESPIHNGGAASLVNNPWLNAPGNATSYLWNYDGTSYRDSSRGNNVWAQEDRDNNNSTYGRAATSSTPQPTLTIDYTPDYTQAPTVTANQRFATTNLFYWNNLMHDLSYLYGFDEPSGNFQFNNQGRGGNGNDYVIADAQDAGGTNNANFSTPVDGSLPRMQMYIFNYTTPNRDGDLDNGIITHEYGHGISNRLTGGPANSSCLSNAEQGGEGWSDYFSLMTSTNWAIANLSDGALARPIGTYVLGQAITGAGIRTYPYSTNMSINPWTYGMMASSGGEVHKIGEIWCMALWEMTWEMIAVDGINPNIFNSSATGGNSAALKLVIEGMRLQPCSPGYIDSRNAILKADTLFFGGKYSCAIWRAFAKRGMGKNASQGSSNSTTDQVADFSNSGSVTIAINQNVTQQEETKNVTYTTKVGSGTCSAISNYILRDTLPSNVDYVSGGIYDSTTRVVSFAVNVPLGGTQNYSFTVKIKSGSYFPPVQLIDESVATSTISSFWTKSSTTTTNWITSTAQSLSAPYSLFTANLTSVSDQKIETTNAITLPFNPPYLIFQGYINAESGWDGGVVEISTDNGATWSDLGNAIISGGYLGTLSSSTNPLSGRKAFTANSGGFVKTTINLSAYAGQSVKFRFRFGSDASVASTGWYIDDIQMKNVPVVNISSALYNNFNSRVGIVDTVTTILQSSVTCNPGVITEQPLNTSVCNGSSTVLSLNAFGTNLSYQWQMRSDSTQLFTNSINDTLSSLNISNAQLSMNGYQFRCLINGTCTDGLSSSIVTLAVNEIPISPSVVNVSRCATGTVLLSGSAASNELIDWYNNQSDLISFATGSNITSPVIQTTRSFFASARDVNTGCQSDKSELIATVLTLPVSPTAVSASRCGVGALILRVTNTNNLYVNWYDVSSGGNPILTGSDSIVTSVLNTSKTYYAEVVDVNCASLRTPVIATINSLPSNVSIYNGSVKCSADTALISASASTGNTIDWFADSLGILSLKSGTQTGVNTFVTPVLTSDTKYWVAQRNLTTGCISTDRVAVSVLFNQAPSAPTANNSARCGAGTVQLTATPPVGSSVAWYSNSSGGSILSTSNSYTTPSISATTIYYAESRVSNCVSVNRSAVSAIVSSVPTAPLGVPGSRCGTGSVTISATPSNGDSIKWYSASTGGTLLLAGSNNYNTPSISANTTYYAESKNAGCSSSARTTVIASINALPATVTTVVNASKCGSDTMTLSATASTGMTINWYSDSTISTILQSGTLTGINKYKTPVLSATTKYWIVQRNLTTGCVSAARKSVTATINARPLAPAVTSASRCGTGTVMLSATAPTNPAGTVAWYSVVSGGTSLSTSSSYTTASLSANTNYYIESKITATGCVSYVRSIATATINSLPSAPVAVNASRCGTGVVTVGATPSAGQTIDWYSASTNGTLLFSGLLNYTTPSITRTTSYYAAARNASTSCVSSTRATVTATVSTTTLAASTSLTGLTSICSIVGTNNSTTYTTTTVSGASSYVWTIPTGAVIDSGSNGLKIKVRFNTAGTNDSIYVQAYNGCLGLKKVLKLTTTGCSTTPFSKSQIQVKGPLTDKTIVNVFPNPFNNQFKVQAMSFSAEMISGKIIDMLGKVVYAFSVRPNEISTIQNHLKTGTYLLQLNQSGKSETIKLIKY